jgi:hypothetical protein
MISSFVGAGIFLIGLVAILCKKPYLTCPYVLIATAGGFFILYTAKLILIDFKNYTVDNKF